MNNLQNHYSEYPYPGYQYRGQIALDPRHSYTSICYQAYGEYRDSNNRQALDAGCGTGSTLVDVGCANPGLKLIGVDLSKTSLTAAAENVSRAGLSDRVALVHGDLMELNISTKFDFIVSTGVIHHADDPLGTLKALSSVLKPDGVMSLLLYATNGRHLIDRLKRLASLFTNSTDGLPEKIVIARKLVNSLLKNDSYKQVIREFRGVWSDDARLADMLFNPCDHSYTIPQLLELLRGAGLKLLFFHDERRWHLPEFNSDDCELRSLFSLLPTSLKWEVCDLTESGVRTNFYFVAGHHDYKPAPVSDDEISTGNLIPMRTPVMRFEKSHENVLANAGFIGSETRFLTEEEVRFIEEIDGKRTVIDISSSFSSVARTIELMRSLHRERLILVTKTAR